MSRPAPPWFDDERALVIIDWSWWLNKAFRVYGLEGMTGAVIGRLTSHVLADRPAHLAIALDAPGETFRHKMRHPSDPEWRYKANRDPKPRDFYELAERCTQLAELHAIPILWADEREADDVMATAATKARAAGYTVWLCTADKDLHALCEDEGSGDERVVLTGVWDNFECRFRGAAETFAHFGVRPDQMADYLAIIGDTSDNIPGVEGLGGTKAADILGAWGTLEDALADEPWTEAQYAQAEGDARALKKRLAITADPDQRHKLEAARAEVMAVRRRAQAHRKLVDSAELVRFSRTLTALDYDAKVRIPWEELPVGGFDAEELRRRYRDLGFTNKAQQVPDYRKRQPWCIPFEDEGDER